MNELLEELKSKQWEFYDGRHLGMKLSIANVPYNFFSIGGNSIDGFYINLAGHWLTVDEAELLSKQLSEAAIYVKKLNEFI